MRSTAVPLEASAPSEVAAGDVWTMPVPNPIVAHWHGRAISLRLAAAVVAAISFVLGAMAMLGLGRRFGVATRSLTSEEVGEMILNPQRPAVAERVQPIATAGARGAEATVSFGADEIAAALAQRRYGVVLLALVVAPFLFALASAGFAVALLVEQELWLLLAMLLVPAGFIATAMVIGVQALSRPHPTSVQASR